MSAKCFFIYTLKKIKKPLDCAEISDSLFYGRWWCFFWWEKSREWSWCVCGVRVKKELYLTRERGKY